MSVADGAAAPVTFSLRWSRAMPAGPDMRVKITEAYARLVARDAYFWAWPLVNIYNRRLAFEQAPRPGLMNGVLPFAPLNTLSMLSDYIQPNQRWVACPNQDVVYGAGIAALDRGPVVVQVPDFGDRFWVYQVVDLRTDAFAELGAMYGTEPGFYLLAGPNWNGETPAGISRVFETDTGTAMVVPRVFMDDTPEDREAIQSAIAAIDTYPLDQFDGAFKRHEWRTLPNLGSPTGGDDAAETKWVFPETFFDQLPTVLADAPPLPGEEARYRQALAAAAAGRRDPDLAAAMTDEARRADAELVAPLLQFRAWGRQLPNNWSTVSNCAAFGTDYFSRTAVAKSNIMVNSKRETAYFYQDLDADGERLNGAHRYTVTFAKDGTPPVTGFWSLTLYDAEHFFAPNDLGRYSLGTKNKALRTGPDGSLTLYIQAEPPSDALRANWLPAPAGADLSLYLRAYGPKTAVLDDTWTPPAVVKSR
jgi:hypothetical protein